MEDKKTKHAGMLKPNSLFAKVHGFKINWGFLLAALFSSHHSDVSAVYDN